jgi:hypothetical protein
MKAFRLVFCLIEIACGFLVITLRFLADRFVIDDQQTPGSDGYRGTSGRTPERSFAFELAGFHSGEGRVWLRISQRDFEIFLGWAGNIPIMEACR